MLFLFICRAKTDILHKLVVFLKVSPIHFRKEAVQLGTEDSVIPATALRLTFRPDTLLASMISSVQRKQHLSAALLLV